MGLHKKSFLLPALMAWDLQRALKVLEALVPSAVSRENIMIYRDKGSKLSLEVQLIQILALPGLGCRILETVIFGTFGERNFCNWHPPKILVLEAPAV